MSQPSFSYLATPASYESVRNTLNRAFASYRAGDLPHAALCCKVVLKEQRKQFDALHLMGLIEYQRGKHSKALRLIGEAIKINPQVADAHCNQAMVVNDLKGPAQAIASVDRALALQPDHIVALNNRGNFLWRLGRHQEALASLERALAVNPGHADAHCNRGNVLCELKRFEEAVVSFHKALAINPRDYLTWHNLANALCQLQRFEHALTSYERSLALKPDDVLVLTDFGNVLQKRKQWTQALTVFDQVLASKPDDIAALRNRGKCLWRLKRLTEALETYDRVLSLRPDAPEVLGERANVLGDMERFEEALVTYDRSLSLAPNNAEVHWNRGLLRLRTGDLSGGSEDYEWRFKKADTAAQLRQLLQPRWDGKQSLESKTILLTGEQGFGDTIQFVRYAPMVAQRAGRVILEVQPALKALLASVQGVSEVVALGEDLPPFDYHCPLMSLPLAFGTSLENIPSKTAGLCASSDRVAAWRGRLGKSGLPRVGIAWAGNPDFIDDHDRSIGLSRLSSMLATPGIQFFSIQTALRAGDAEVLARNPRVTHLGDEIQDFSDTAAIITLLDLLISSDTSVVHLAGALGRPVWVLLQRVADWRWLVEREDSPWYPSARLFRQKEIGSWEPVVERVETELTKWTSY